MSPDLVPLSPRSGGRRGACPSIPNDGEAGGVLAAGEPRREAPPPVGVRGAVALAVSLVLAGWSPFQAEQPDVREGNEKLLGGDAAAALERYGKAEAEVGPRPEIDYDRGNALHRAGRLAEAEEAWRRAAAKGDPRLASRALQNTGNARARQGDRAGAIAAYADALARDPSNEDARHDLEVLLRREAEPPPPAPSAGENAQGEPQGEESDAERPSQPESGPERDAPPPRAGEQPAAPPQDAPPDAAPEPRPEPDAQDDARAGAAPRPEPERREGEPEDAAGREPLGRQEAEALLDALRSRERNMPMAPPRASRTERRNVEKDW